MFWILYLKYEDPHLKGYTQPKLTNPKKID